MRILTGLVGLMTLGLLVGCSSEPGQIQESGSIGGTVMLNGQPLKNVMLHLNPTGEGHPTSTPVDEMGKFSAKLIPGEFFVYIQPNNQAKDRAAAAKAFAAVPKNYQEVSADHKVTLKAGNDNTIELK